MHGVRRGLDAQVISQIGFGHRQLLGFQSPVQPAENFSRPPAGKHGEGLRIEGRHRPAGLLAAEMRMPIRAFQHHGLAAVGSCTLPLPPAWLAGCRQQADLTGPACSSAFSRLLLIDQGHSSQNQVRNPIHIQMSLIVLYKCS